MRKDGIEKTSSSTVLTEHSGAKLKQVKETKARYDHIIDRHVERDRVHEPMHEDLKNLIRINMAYNFFTGFAAPFIAIFFNQFGSLEEVGIAVAIMYIIQGVITLFASNLLSRFGSRLVVLVTQLIEGFRIFGFLFVRNVYDVYILQMLGGLTQGFNQPAYSNVYVNVMSDESSKSIGRSSGFTTIAYGLSTLISGFLIGSFGYAPVLIIWGCQEIVYGLFIYYKVR